MRLGHSLEAYASARLTVVLIAFSFLLWACSSAATGTPASSPAPQAQESPTPTDSITTPTQTATAGVTDARDVVSEEEAAALLGEAIQRSSLGAFTFGDETIEGWDFSGEAGGYLTVGFVPNGEDQFERARATWPGVTHVAGLGDEAFTANDSAVAIVAALKGNTAIYLYSRYTGPDRIDALKALMITALSST